MSTCKTLIVASRFRRDTFTPKYNPWNQRLCLAPDSNLFNAIADGRASVATDQIDAFTETGPQLKSGEHLDADIVVTAGLVLKLMSGLQLTVEALHKN